MDKESQLRKLVDSVSPRTAHQYKSYGDKFIRWIRDSGLLGQGDVSDELLYKDLPFSSHLVHWFLIETLVRVKNDDDVESRIPTLKKIISSLKFLYKLCVIHGNRNSLDEKYLENVVKLHSNWVGTRNSKQTSLPIVKISLNLWNCYAETLPEKYFKTSLERLRFLVDFHFRVYTNLSYEQRSKIKLSQLQSESGVICIDQVAWSSLQVYLPNSPQHLKSHRPMAIRPQGLPFLCPMTSLAAYLYLRFYGVCSATKGDGFPDLLGSDTDDHSWEELPLIRGKSLSDYPREETLSNYYSTVFRYCHLPYKRREYFNKGNPEYPTLPSQAFDDFFQHSCKSKAAAFPHNVPYDFYQVMNFKSPYERQEADEALSGLPQSLLVQIFPEIEQYKRRDDELDPTARRFLKLMEHLRERLLLSLPWIQNSFPQHDLLKDPLFQNADFQSYFHKTIGTYLVDSNLPFDVLPGFEKLSPATLQDLLMEAPKADFNNQVVPKATNVSPPPVGLGVDEVLNKTYQFVQYQTLTNFQMLLSFLSNIFDKLEMKKSSREFMIHQLNLLQDTIVENINLSKPQDVEDYMKKEEETNEDLKTQRKSDGLLAIDDSVEEKNSDDDETDGDGMQDELKFMVNELVGDRVRSTVKLQMDHWESKIREMITRTVSDELAKVLSQDGEPIRKRPRLSTTPSLTNNQSNSSISMPTERAVDAFKMNTDLSTVEEVILEWFTPNPDMNNQCVHSMNKSLGKEWRTGYERLYKERKLIVEFYIYLVNQKDVDRYEAVEISEKLKDSCSKGGTLSAFAKLLKDWKRDHDSSFEGLIEQLNA